MLNSRIEEYNARSVIDDPRAFRQAGTRHALVQPSFSLFFPMFYYVLLIPAYIPFIEGPLGRATPPPFKFRIGTQVQIGERKHAMPDRRLQKDDFVMKCIRQILQVWLSLRMCAM